ncbi:MAG: hypothetical protein H0Z24_03550 [Thermosipho sp. (in: Bacteria)]|nr:hypothetical protein [Thermosipho sp. (in: thermotogales)]
MIEIKRKLLFLIVTLLVVGLISAFSLYSQGYVYKNTVQEKVKEWVIAVANGQKESALALSSGQVRFHIAAKQNVIPKYEVISIDVKVKAASKDWAKANVTLETKDEKGIIDVHWYDIYLNKNKHWEIYRVEEVSPDLDKIVLMKASKEDIKQAQIVFQNYLTLLTQNEYVKAANYLIGRAKNAHVRDEGKFKKSTVLTTFKNLNFHLLYNSKKHLILKCAYTVEKRPVSVAASLFKTSEGWKIYNVSQN